MNSDTISRRGFVKTLAVAGLAAKASLLAQTSPTTTSTAAAVPKRKLKVGLVGCGGRGSGALANLIEAAPLAGVELEVYAVADAFQERVQKVVTQFGVAPQRGFVGFDAYRKVMAEPIDLVVLATPPNFRPIHFEAAVAAGKHAFIEKPVAVDVPGCRRILAAGEMAQQKGLTVIAGAQRRHLGSYLSNEHAIREGAIGRITGGSVMWNQDRLWFKERLPGESDANYLARNWVNFLETSGDHIVEQHFHNLDVANWFIGRTPVSALGFGGRVRRITGNQYDFFSVNYDYGQGCQINSSCRQINGTYTRVGEFFTGTEGTVYGGGKMEKFGGQVVTQKQFVTHPDGQVQEQVDFLNCILNDKPVNDSKYVAETTLTAIMGRISAYTGQLVRWSDLTVAGGPYYDVRLSPTAEDFESGSVVAPPEGVVPRAGTDEVPPPPAQAT